MHLALINIPASGHVNPSLPLVAELVRRGVRVTYFCTNEFEPAIRHAGARFRPYESLVASRMNAPTKPKLPDELPAILMEEGEFAAGQILAALSNDRPDALINDSFAVAGRIVGRALGVPQVQLRATYAANEQFSFIRESCPGHDGHAALDHPAFEREQQLASRLSQRYGIGGIDLYDIFEHAEPLNIVFVSADFHPKSGHFDDRHILVGPQIGSRLDSGRWRPPADDVPLIYASFGTVFGNNPRLYPNLIEALGSGPWRAIVSVGGMHIPKVPPNVELMRYAPQLEILAAADLFITHAGMNSVQEALWFGVPMIALPQMHEQSYSARHLASLGLGLALEDSSSVSVDTFTASIRQVLSDHRFRERVREFKGRTRQCGGYTRAADEILKFSAAGSSVH